MKTGNPKKFIFDTRIFAIIGVILFVLILSKTDFNYLYTVLLGLNPLFLGLAFIMTILCLLVKSFKWRLLIKSAGYKYSFFRSIIVWTISFAYGFVTPARFGDFMRVFFLKSDINVPKVKGLIICLLDRLLDLFSLIIGTLFVYSLSVSFPTITVTIILVSIVLLVVLLLILDKLFKNLPKKFNEVYNKIRNFLIDTLKLYKPNELIIPLLFSLLSWIFSYIQGFMVLNAMNKSVNFLLFSAAYSTAILFSLLPISIGGLGTTEATLYFFLSNYLTLEEVIALAFVSNVIGLWIPALVGFVLNSFIKAEVK